MSASSKVILLTETATGSTVEFSSNKIVYVSTSGTGAKVTFTSNGAALKEIIVDETPAAIASASDVIIAVTNASDSVVSYINADRILEVINSGTGSLTSGLQAGSADTTLTPVEVTIVAHGLTTNEYVTIAGVTGTGASAINGTWAITSTGANTFTLQGSVGIALSVANVAAATLTYNQGNIYYNHEGAAPNVLQVLQSKEDIAGLVNAIAV